MTNLLRRHRGPKIPVTVLIQTKNEAPSIERCIEMVRDFSEIIVVDSNSTDGTPDLARNAGARVVNFTWNGRYPKKKQWQLDELPTVNKWVLLLDADEHPDPQLISSMRSIFTSAAPIDASAFDLRLSYTFSGRTLHFGHRVVKRTLVHRDRVKFPEIDDLGAPGMGELEGHYQPTVDTTARTIAGTLVHDDKDPVRTWFERHNRYSDWEAHLATHHGPGANRHRSAQGRLFAAIPGKPLAFFLYTFVFRLGFLDGRAGFDYAFALSAYYWQIGLKIREARRSA